MNLTAPSVTAILVCVCCAVKPLSDSSDQLIRLQSGSMDVLSLWRHDRNRFPIDGTTLGGFMKYATRMLVLALTMLPLLATAQLTGSQKIVAQVPFGFVVGSKVVPSGEWIVQRATMDAKT